MGLLIKDIKPKISFNLKVYEKKEEVSCDSKFFEKLKDYCYEKEKTMDEILNRSFNRGLRNLSLININELLKKHKINSVINEQLELALKKEGIKNKSKFIIKSMETIWENEGFI